MGSRLISKPNPNDPNSICHAIARLDKRLNTSASPTFASMGLTGLTENALMYANGDGVLTPLAAATNGQLIIGNTGTVPSIAALTGTAGEITITNGAGSITLSLAAGAAGTLDHDDLINTHNLTTDIDHDQLTNVHQDVNTDANPIFAGLIPAADDTHDIGLIEESEPSFTLDINQTLNSGSTTLTDASSKGATFTPNEDYDLGRVSFWLRRSGAGTEPITLHVSETTAGLPTGGDLATKVVDGSGISNSELEWFDITLDSPLSLTNGRQYAVWPTVDSGSSFTIGFKDSDEYAGGNYLQGIPWSSVPTYDLTVRIYKMGETEYTYTRWNNLYLSGLLHDGTVSLSVANAKAAYDFTTTLNAATDGQLMIGDTGDNPALATLTGTAKRILVSNSAGSITLSGPQDIDTVDSPTFANLSLGTGELTAGSINRATDTLTLEIAGTPELSISTSLIAIANGLTVDTNTLVVDAVTGRVGFGTTDPAGIVHISLDGVAIGNTNGFEALILSKSGSYSDDIAMSLVAGTNSGTCVITFGDTNDIDAGRIRYRNKTTAMQESMEFVVNTNEIFRIQANGNLGLNEVAPEVLFEMTSNVPYFTLHNSTEENNDGGRESRINFKGEQGVDPWEETTLARITVSHDGTGADDKGKMVFSVNDGNDGDTPTDRFKIDAAGVTHIGDGTNEIQISGTGDLIFHGSAGLAYGGCYGNHFAWTQYNAVQNTWYPIDHEAMVDGQLNNITHDGRGVLTCTNAGVYYVSFEVTWEVAGANIHTEFGVEVNGTVHMASMIHTESKFSAKQGQNACTALLAVGAGETLQVAVRTVDDTVLADYEVDVVNLNCIQVGG